jgi:hypothetical protein
MFRALFLGHQGWLFSSSSTHVLVDPLLDEAFGHGGILGSLHPPRLIEPSEFPPIDAVVYTHEHEDHFSIPSLARLDRRVPIYFSARCSVAAEAILSEMGFTARRVYPGQDLRISELTFSWMSPDHVRQSNQDEWDVLPFLVRDQGGHGSFVSTVDVPRPPGFFEAVRAVSKQPGIFCLTNNVMAHGYQVVGGQTPAGPEVSGVGLGAAWCDQLATVVDAWGLPAAVVAGGGGWAFAPPLGKLNRHAFPASSDAVLRSLQALLPDGRPCFAPLPGQAVIMRSGLAERVDAQAPFVRTRPPEDWPVRTYTGPGTLIDHFPAACGRTSVVASGWTEIERGLAQLAAFAYGREEFRQLYSLKQPLPQGIRPTWALVLKDGSAEGWRTMAYEPSAASFTRVEEDLPFDRYLAGLECWAADFLALLRGELTPSAVLLGRCRLWNRHPELFEASFPRLFATFFHPLFRPVASLSLYRRLLDQERDRSGEG